MVFSLVWSNTNTMRYITLVLSSLVIIGMSGFTKAKKLTVTSTAFANNGSIPVKYTCLGQEINPPLNVTDIPPEAKSLAVIVCDPDAPTKITAPVTTTKVVTKKGSKKKTTIRVQESRTVEACTINGYTHWIFWNVDVSAQIPEGFRPENVGMNSAGTTAYKGMCPPSGTHHYHFVVYALDTKLNIGKGTDKATLEKLMEGHILASGELVGIYNKAYK